jgi:protoheme IX farnesyltransferase
LTAVTLAPGTRLLAFLELGKLRLSGLAVFAVVTGLLLGSEDPVPPLRVAAVALGTLLAAAGGSALNMWRERELDRRMERTRGRPLPSGRLRPQQALGFGIGAVAAGLLLLFAVSNWLATALCAAIVASYVLIYTPLKRVTTLNTIVGAFPGALPPVVGYAASAGTVDQRAWVLFLILYFWQVPHFLAIAWRYRDDYRRAGMRMLPVEDPTGARTAVQMVVWCGALVLVSLFAYPTGVSGPLYLISAAALGAVFFAATLLAARARTDPAMRLCFHVSIVYLPLLFAVMLLDRGIA